ncbi:hypothetical protein XAXN_07790 [Xanthomonas axonopodis]|uniref:Uncharacterized protein n=1 Tax=Xanthomonas axonopodis TaxID=53413 RepID=A0A0P6VHI3_9XANT|nr:hypothetical protein XAXN_07790 [Xanthomonas axonopodis]
MALRPGGRLRGCNASAALQVTLIAIKLNVSIRRLRWATRRPLHRRHRAFPGAGKAQYGSGSARGEANG